MTEYDLWEYARAKAAHRRALEKLMDYESVIYNAKGQVINGMPAEHTYNPDKMADVAHRHSILIEDLNEAAAAVARAGDMLDAVERMLGWDEGSFLHNRYRLGRSWSECEEEMHYSNSHVARIRKTILIKIASFQNMGVNGIEKTYSNV
jgi:hypothetical protein